MNKDNRTKHSIDRLRKALGYSFDGVCAAVEEAGFRELLILHAVLMLLLCVQSFSVAVTMVLVLASFLSIVVELLNTGIEAAVDHTSLEQHPLAKRAKDVGSAAQYITLLMVAILWCIAWFA